MRITIEIIGQKAVAFPIGFGRLLSEKDAAALMKEAAAVSAIDRGSLRQLVGAAAGPAPSPPSFYIRHNLLTSHPKTLAAVFLPAWIPQDISIDSS
jgi:hypothetical protein